MAPRRTYKLADVIPTEHEAAFGDHDALTKQLLWNRGIKVEDLETFLHPDYDKHVHDPFLLTDMDRVVSRVLTAIESNEKIVIYSDYDCDGIPGGVVMHDFFVAIGYTNFVNYIPHRHHEGFGLNTEAVIKLAEDDVALIITIDCGINDHKIVDVANTLGVDVIITDHHEPAETLPSAYAIINPKRDDAYPFKDLCGSGVIYKLVQALVAKGTEEGKIEIAKGKEKWFLDMVGIATIADMVPLIGENRVFAKYGLHVLRKSRRPGLQQLLRKARASQQHLTEDDIGFTIGPRINAASRMDSPEEAFHMLATSDEAEAGAHVSHLEKLNDERRGTVAAMTKEIKKRISEMTDLKNVIVMGNPEWRPSLVGLSANSLAETYKRPVFLWGRDGHGNIKGSCRSEGNTSVLALMEHAKDSFIEFGGHHVAGGFGVVEDKIHTLGDALNDAYATVIDEPIKDFHEIQIDADLQLEDVNEKLIATLKQLAPFGVGNARPVFRFKNVSPARVETFGKTKNHTKLVFQTNNGMRDALAFFKEPDAFSVTPQSGHALTLIANVEQSFFMGRLQTRLRIIDIV